MKLDTRSNDGKKRINLYVPEHFVNELDSIAVECGVNRTSLLNMIIKQYLDQQNMFKLTKLAERENSNKF